MRRTSTLAFLLLTVFIDMLGLGIVVPIIPALMTSITGHAAGAARWSGVIDTSFGIMQFLASPLLGRFSDRYGRRPILLLAMSLLGVDWLVHAVANTPISMVVAHAAAGALGGTVTVVRAYIADITPPEERPTAYGYVGAAFAFGFVVGPVLGGLLGEVDVRLPFYVAAGLSVVNVAYGLFVLPESRPGDRVTSLHWRVANPLHSIGSMLNRPALKRLVISRLLADIGRVADQNVLIFTMVVRFGLSTTKLGVLMAVAALIGGIVGARLSGPVVQRLGVRRSLIVSLVLGASSMAGYGLVPSVWLIAPCLLAGALGNIDGGAFLTWITGLTGADEQGTVQGALTGISAIAESAVPLAAMSVFAWSLHIPMAGLVLVIGAAFYVLSALVVARAPQPAAAKSVRS